MKDFFENLTKEIKKHDEIIIMTHSTPDLDGLGSAIVLSEVIKKFNKKCFIVAPKNLINKTLNKALNYLNNEGIILPFKYEKNIENNNSLLIILDVQEDRLLECKNMLFKIKDRCLIDHHSIEDDRISHNGCEFLDEKMSSTVEIISNYLKYLDVKLDSIFYTLLLSGLYQDTNYFILKTTEDTFLAASYLLHMGADIKLQHDFLKESMKSLINRYEYVKKCDKLCGNVYLCVIDDRECTNITVAKMADEMLKFEEVDLAFAIGRKDNGQIVISGRSCDNKDVCSIMRNFGGGGHFGAAAACVSDSSLEEVIDKLKKIVRRSD